MIYQYEELDKQTETMKNRRGLTKEEHSRQLKVEAPRNTAAQAILLNEQWRSELFRIPPRSLAEIRWYWVQQDPTWLASEMNMTEDQRITRDHWRGH